MKIVEQIKWWKLRKFVWDTELEQICGEIIYNNPTEEFVFNPDKCAFDSKQLERLSKLVKQTNEEESE